MWASYINSFRVKPHMRTSGWVMRPDKRRGAHPGPTYAMTYTYTRLGHGTSVRWMQGVRKGDPILKVAGLTPRFQTQLHATTSLSTGGCPASDMHLLEGGFHVVHPLAFWSWLSRVANVMFGCG